MARRGPAPYPARMGVVFGLAAAILWGTADFLARLSAERIGSRRTLFYMQLFGAFCMGLVMLAPAAAPSWPASQVLGLAALLGLVNMTGGALLYRALEVGTVSLVSPISSTFAAIAALLAITVAHERPTGLQLLGLALCALGVVAASIPPRDPKQPLSRRGLGLAALAALVWGVGFFSLRYVVADLGPFFPVFIARWTSVAALGLIALVRRNPLPRPRGAFWLVFGVAACDSAAFAAYNLGISRQLTSVVTIISSLFSAVTVLLAFVFLRERLGKLQWAAVGVVLLGVALVSSAG